MDNYLRGILNLPRVLNGLERTLVSVLIFVILIAGILWWQKTASRWAIKPLKGGAYTEGIVNHSPAELDLITTKLTKIGLTYINHKNEVKGALAERWEVSGDGKTYTFHLRPGVAAKDVAELYAGQPTWQNITIRSEDNKLVMTLKQPFAPLLSFTSDPVIDGGPYRKERQTKNEISFAANPEFILGEPHIQRIVLVLYPDQKAVKAALQRQEVVAADQPIRGVGGTTIKKLRLTRRTALLFNLEKPTFKDKSLRERVRDGKKLDQPLEVTLVTNQDPELLERANQFVREAAEKNLKVSIRSVNPIVLERDILPNDDYDLLLRDLNYGYDEDPYPYWHSSQIIPPGQNYAGFNSKEADKLIEEARQTLDQQQRQKKYQQFQAILEREVPAIFYPDHDYGYTVAKRIKGISEGVGAVPSDRFTEVWQWYIKSRRQPK